MSKYRNCLILICNVITVRVTRVVKQDGILLEGEEAHRGGAEGGRVGRDGITATMNCWNYWAWLIEGSFMHVG
jgi:hypothetical protein